MNIRVHNGSLYAQSPVDARLWLKVQLATPLRGMANWCCECDSNLAVLGTLSDGLIILASIRDNGTEID